MANINILAVSLIVANFVGCGEAVCCGRGVHGKKYTYIHISAILGFNVITIWPQDSAKTAPGYRYSEVRNAAVQGAEKD